MSNLAIATGGASGLIIVDVHFRHGGHESLAIIEREHGVTPTLRVRTGDGWHDYYRLPPDVRIGCPRSKWPGIDLKSTGGLVAVPPSLHASGNCYEIIDDRPVAPAPAWLLEALNASKARYFVKQQAGSGHGLQRTTTLADEPIPPSTPQVVAAMQGAPEGERNVTLYRYASSLRARNIHRTEAELLVRACAEHCLPPLPADEAMRALDSAWKHPPEFRGSDVGNAQRLAYHHSQDIRFVAYMGQWVVWDGSRWRVDTGRHEVMRCAKRTARSIYAEAQAEEDTDRRKGLASWAKQSESAWRLEAMIKLPRSEPEIAITSHALDANPMLLELPYGTLELCTGVLRAPRREDYITKVSPVVFDPDAKCPRWRQFLEEIMNGNAEMISFL